MADNETTADIIAWLRRPREGENAYLTLWRDEIADRLEAAHRREVQNALDAGGFVEASRKNKQVGNAAKLREALETALKTIRGVINSTISPRSNTVFDCRDKLSAALAAPPRNCDRFGSCTQAKEEWWKTEVLPRVDGVVSGAEPPFADWLLATATEKEGGAKWARLNR